MLEKVQKFLFGGVGSVVKRISELDFSQFGKNIVTGFGFLLQNVKNVGFLDPNGVSVHKMVHVPLMMVQVSDRDQWCEFLPPSFFNQRMVVHKGQLIVNGVAFPMSPLRGEGVERVMTRDGNKLYAINTNQNRAAFDAIGLDYNKYRNKRLIIACDGDRIVPTRPGESLKLMKAVYDAKISPETRRIVNQRTGRTAWLPTLLIAMPCNLIAGVANIVIMLPHGVLDGISRIFRKIATVSERKAEHLHVSKERGTIEGGSTKALAFWTGLGVVCRVLEKTIGACTCIVGCLRTLAVNLVRSVPIFVSACYNCSAAHLNVLKCHLVSTTMQILNNIKQYCGGVKEVVSRYVSNNDVSSGKDYEYRSLTEERGSSNELPKVDFSPVSNVAPEATFSLKDGVKLKSPESGKNVKSGDTVTINKSDMRSLKEAGDVLASSGTTISYGTTEQVRRRPGGLVSQLSTSQSTGR